jgi:hypothetical protein
MPTDLYAVTTDCLNESNLQAGINVFGFQFVSAL